MTKTTICGIPVTVRLEQSSAEITPAYADSFTDIHERLITNWLLHKGNVVLAVRDTIKIEQPIRPDSIRGL